MIKTLTPGEIAKLCDVHQRTVSRWIASGKLKGHQLPGRGDYRVLQEDFYAFAHNHGLPLSALPSSSKASDIDTILVIDDEAAVRRALSRLFSSAGYRVITAENSFSAGVCVERECPSLITLDLMMPGIQLSSVYDFLRNHSKTSKTPVIVISAAPEDQLSRAKDEGAAAVFSKPFNNNALLDRVASLVKTAHC